MRLTSFILTSLILLFGFAQLSKASEETLKPYVASYKAHIKNKISMNGKAERKLTQTPDGRWRMNFEVEALAADAKEFSVFEVVDNLIRPYSYDYRLEGFFIKNKRRTANFDWASKRATGKYKKKTWEYPIDQTMDPLAFQLQMSLDLIAGKDKMSHEVINKGKLEIAAFEKIGEERIETKLGKLDAIVLKKIRKNSKRETKMWFAKDDPLKLLRFEQREKDGEEYIIELQTFRYLP